MALRSYLQSPHGVHVREGNQPNAIEEATTPPPPRL